MKNALNITLLALLVFAGSALAALIDPSRLTDWTPGTSVGVQGGIPTNRTMFADVSLPPYNADKTGVASAVTAIQNAINACPAGQYVYFPAGTYKVDANIGLKSQITLKGAGKNLTTLKAAPGAGYMLAIDNYIANFWNPQNGEIVTAGATRGSTTVTVGSGASNYTVGMLMSVSRTRSTSQNENPIVMGTGEIGAGFDWLLKSVHQVVSKTATTVTFSPPLSIDMNALECRANAASVRVTGIGVEDMYLDGNFQAQKGIYTEGIDNSWFLRVKFQNCNNYSLELAIDFRVEVRDCDILDLNHSGNNGAGLLFGGTCSSLIENNVVRNSFPGTEINAGSANNVIAYNYFENDNGQYGIDTNHAPHQSYNLYEGNITQSMVCDGFHGSSSTDIVFRNWITGEHTGFVATDIGYTFVLKRLTRNYTVVGNVFGNPNMNFPAYDTTAYGQPHIGNSNDNGLLAPPWADFNTSQPPGGGFDEFDTQVAPTTTLRMNYYFYPPIHGIPSTPITRGKNEAQTNAGYTFPSEALGGDTFPNSLYRSSKPVWFGNLAWPPVNPQSPGTPTLNQIKQLIPAGYRYINGVDPPPGGPDVTPPVVSGTPSVDTTGQILTVAFSEPVQNGAGGSSGWTINASGGAATVSFTSGAGSAIYLLGISRPIAQGETVTMGYTQPGNGAQDLAVPPNNLATFSGVPVTNGSTQGSVVTPIITLAAGPYFGPQSTTITEATPGAAIHYTTNGSTPTIGSPLYSTAIPISANMTIRAIATKTGFPDSPVATSAYEVVSWTITPAATKTFAIPAVATSIPWVFTVTPTVAPSNTVISLGPSPISVQNDWSIAINFNASGAIQAKNGAAFAATQVVNYTTAPVVIRVDINYAAKTFSATANNVVFATNYAFATSQPSPVSLNYVGLFTSLQNATISSMSFQTGSSSGRYIGLRNVTNSP